MSNYRTQKIMIIGSLLITILFDLVIDGDYCPTYCLPCIEMLWMVISTTQESI